MKHLFKVILSAIAFAAPAPVIAQQSTMVPLLELFSLSDGEAEMNYMLSRCVGIYGAMMDYNPEEMPEDAMNEMQSRMTRLIEFAFGLRSEGKIGTALDNEVAAFRQEVAEIIANYGLIMISNHTNLGSAAPEGSDFAGDVSMCDVVLESI